MPRSVPRPLPPDIVQRQAADFWQSDGQSAENTCDARRGSGRSLSAMDLSFRKTDATKAAIRAVLARAKQNPEKCKEAAPSRFRARASARKQK